MSDILYLRDQIHDDMNAAIDALTFGAGKRDRGEPPAAPPIRRILACHDGSSAGAAVIEWATSFATAFDARVTVATVAPHPYEIDTSWAGIYRGPMFADVARSLSHMHRVAEDARSLLRGRDIAADTASVVGEPAGSLSHLAHSMRADLTIVGTRDPHGPLGRVAHAMLHRAEGSVLIARAPPRSAPILAATDGSRASLVAVALAQAYAARAGADLTIQHVLEHPEAGSGAPPDTYLRDVVAKMRLPTPPHVTYALDMGVPTRRILTRAAEERSDLVALGASGLGRVASFLLGSVSQRVASAAGTNVLVVRERAKDA